MVIHDLPRIKMNLPAFAPSCRLPTIQNQSEINLEPEKSLFERRLCQICELTVGRLLRGMLAEIMGIEIQRFPFQNEIL